MPPMSDRWYLFLASMSDAARTVLIIWALAHAILLSRWSIRYIPARFRVLAAFDVWIVALDLYLFITA